MRTLDSIVHEIVRWQRRQFPNSSTASAIDHLKEEIDELAENPDGEEWADCMFLLLAISDRAGIDRAVALERKLAINRARTWIEQPDGSFRHDPDHEVDCGAEAGVQPAPTPDP